MSPATLATRDQGGGTGPVLLPLPTADLFLRLAKEIVVDWQLPIDGEHKG